MRVMPSRKETAGDERVRGITRGVTIRRGDAHLLIETWFVFRSYIIRDPGQRLGIVYTKRTALGRSSDGIRTRDTTFYLTFFMNVPIEPLLRSRWSRN